MTEWQNGRMTEWQNGRMTEWQNGRMTKWQNDRMVDGRMVDYILLLSRKGKEKEWIMEQRYYIIAFLDSSLLFIAISSSFYDLSSFFTQKYYHSNYSLFSFFSSFLLFFPSSNPRSSITEWGSLPSAICHLLSSLNPLSTLRN